MGRSPRETERQGCRNCYIIGRFGGRINQNRPLRMSSCGQSGDHRTAGLRRGGASERLGGRTEAPNQSPCCSWALTCLPWLLQVAEKGGRASALPSLFEPGSHLLAPASPGMLFRCEARPGGSPQHSLDLRTKDRPIPGRIARGGVLPVFRRRSRGCASPHRGRGVGPGRLCRALIAVRVFLAYDTEFFWSSRIGFEDRFWTEITVKIVLFFVGAGSAFAFFVSNILTGAPRALGSMVRCVLLLAGLFLAVLLGFQACGCWEETLLYLNQTRSDIPRPRLREGPGPPADRGPNRPGRGDVAAVEPLGTAGVGGDSRQPAGHPPLLRTDPVHSLRRAHFPAGGKRPAPADQTDRPGRPDRGGLGGHLRGIPAKADRRGGDEGGGGRAPLPRPEETSGRRRSNGPWICSSLTRTGSRTGIFPPPAKSSRSWTGFSAGWGKGRESERK